MRARLLALLLLATGCAEVQSRHIRSLRGPPQLLPTADGALRARVAALAGVGRVVFLTRTVDGFDVVGECLVRGRYRSRPTSREGISPVPGSQPSSTSSQDELHWSEEEITELMVVDDASSCAGATHVVTGFTTGRVDVVGGHEPAELAPPPSEIYRGLVRVSLARLHGGAMDHLVTRTHLDPGPDPEAWTVRTSDGEALCRMPCEVAFVPHPFWRAGYAERDADGLRSGVPFSPLDPGQDARLTLKTKRQYGAWPVVPIWMTLLGLGGAAGVVGIVASGGLTSGPPESGLSGVAAPAKNAAKGVIVLPILGLAAVGLTVGGIRWLAKPPAVRPHLVEAR